MYIFYIFDIFENIMIFSNNDENVTAGQRSFNRRYETKCSAAMLSIAFETNDRLDVGVLELGSV